MDQNPDCPNCRRLQTELEEIRKTVAALEAKLPVEPQETASASSQKAIESPTRDGQHVKTRGAAFVFLVFLVSRIVIFSAMAISPWFITPVTGAAFWNLDSPILRPLFRWDTGWYMSIANQGYSYNGNPGQQQNVGFFPLYPLTCRLCNVATGMAIPVCAVLLSNIAFLAGLAALFALITWEVGPDVARSATLLLAFFPASFFFSTMYTESFFLLFSVLAFAAFRKKKLIEGGVWAGLATATRVSGILLFIPLLYESLPYIRERRMRWHVIAACILAGSGLGGFMLYLWISFGDPLAYFHIVRGAPHWRGGFALPFRQMGQAFGELLRGQISPAPFDVTFALMFIALACTFPSSLPQSYSLYTIVGVALPLFGERSTLGLTRYINVLFPGFIVLAILGRRKRWITWVHLSLFVVVLVYFSMRFAQWHWVG